MNQEKALKILQSGANVFLTGSAGTGKTYVLSKYIQTLRAHGVAVAITASTGIAATHLGGQTIHSWAGMGIKEHFTTQDLDKIAKKKKVREQIEKTKVLILDEISMVSKNMLENLDQILQYIKISREPFGGMQIVLCGDFFQLPPVSRVRLPSREKYCFMSSAWVSAGFQICYLQTQYRQEDNDLADFLNEMRTGELCEGRVHQLRECIEETHAEPAEDVPIRLYTHNADVDKINFESLKELDMPAVSFRGSGKGEKQLVESLKKSILAREVITLKEGAPVMFIKNNPEAGYHNGTLGTVMGFDKEGHPEVITREGQKIIAKPTEWRINDSLGQAVAAYTQVPLRLAWAITVHKSQGMTLDSAEIDLSKTFEPGQGYVALSRVKGWAGLRLLGCNSNALQMDPLVLKADARFRELSAENEEKLTKSDAEYTKIFAKRVVALGGTTNPQKMKENSAKMKAKVAFKPKTPKVSTYLLTKRLIEEKKTIKAMVEARKMSEDTIMKHISHLMKENKDLDITHLRPDKKMLAEIATGFAIAKTKAKKDQLDQYGDPKLRLVYDLLNEKYNYRDLKLAKLFVN